MNTDQIAFTTDEITKSLQISYDAAVVVNKAGIIVNANGQAASLFGYIDQGEMIGREIHTLLPDSLREKHHWHIKHYFEYPQSRPMGEGLHLLGQKRDSTEFPIDVGLRPVSIAGSSHALAIIRDKTIQIQMQTVFEQRIASFSLRVEELNNMIGKSISPFSARISTIEQEIIPQLTERVERVEKSMSDFGDQWKEVMPTFKRIDNFFKNTHRILLAVGGILLTAVISQFVIWFFHLFGH